MNKLFYKKTYILIVNILITYIFIKSYHLKVLKIVLRHSLTFSLKKVKKM